jgi:hypothetical protein
MIIVLVVLASLGGLMAVASIRTWVFTVLDIIWQLLRIAMLGIGHGLAWFLGGVPGWFLWLYRHGRRLVLFLGAIAVGITLLLFAALMTGYYDIMAGIFFVMGIVMLPLFLGWNKISRRIGLGSARMLGTWTMILFWSALLCMATPKLYQLMTARQLTILLVGLVGASVLLTWLRVGRVFMALSAIPLLCLAFLSAPSPLLTEVHGWTVALTEKTTEQVKLKTAQTSEATTQIARDTMPHNVNAQMTIGHVLRPLPVFIVTFDKDGKASDVAKKLGLDGKPRVLQPGAEFLTWNPEPELHILNEPAHEILLPDDTGSYISQAKPNADSRLFITARTDCVRLEQELTPPRPIWEMEEVDNFKMELSGDEETVNPYEKSIEGGHRLYFPVVEPRPAKGDLELLIGFKRFSLEPGANIEVEIKARPVFVVREGAGTFKLYVQHFAPKGSAASASPPLPTATVAAGEARGEKVSVVKYFNDTFAEPIALWQILPGAPAGQEKHLLRRIQKGWGWWQNVSPSDILVVEDPRGNQLGWYSGLTAPVTFKF